MEAVNTQGKIDIVGGQGEKIEIWPRKLITFGQNIGNEGNRGR